MIGPRCGLSQVMTVIGPLLRRVIQLCPGGEQRKDLKQHKVAGTNGEHNSYYMSRSSALSRRAKREKDAHRSSESAGSDQSDPYDR